MNNFRLFNYLIFLIIAFKFNANRIIVEKKRSFFGFFSKEKKKPTANDKSEITSKQSKFNDTRSRSSIETKDTNSSRFLDTEGELIKINKKLNQILQLIETQNKSLLDNVMKKKKFFTKFYFFLF